jgi:hypothetical protein
MELANSSSFSVHACEIWTDSPRWGAAPGEALPHGADYLPKLPVWTKQGPFPGKEPMTSDDQ